MNVEFLEAAQAELDEAFQWYEAQQPNLGVQFLTEFDAAIRRIVAFPKSVAVAHLHRKPNYWLDRLD